MGSAAENLYVSVTARSVSFPLVRLQLSSHDQKVVNPPRDKLFACGDGLLVVYWQ